MQFSFSTVYTTVLTSNILFILTACLLQNKKLLFKVGYSLIGIVTAMAVLRLIFPFEFAFTQNIGLPKWLSFLISGFHYALFYIADFKVTPWVLSCLIWTSGTLYQFLRLIKELCFIRKYLVQHGIDVTAKHLYSDTLSSVCENSKCKVSFLVFKLSGISSPMLYGLITPHILLPDTLSLSKQQLYYVLSHEVSHYTHGDIFLKYVLRLLTILYWWNPACYALKKQAELLFEMRIDDSIVGVENKCKQEYLECLYMIAVHSTVCSAFPHSLCIDFGAKNSGDLTKRFEMLIHNAPRTNKVIKAGTLLIALLLFLGSYLFIFEASYVPPEIENAYITPSSNDTYFIQKEDGSYDMYFGNIYIETLDSLEGYSKEIPIYHSTEEIQHEITN